MGIAGCLVVVAAISGALPDPDLALFYVRQFGTGLIGLPLIDAFDFHLVVIGTFVVAVLIGVTTWLGRESASSRGGTAPSVAIAYVGLFGLATVPYYLNRPVITTLVGGTFYVWALCLVLLGWMAWRATAETRRRLRIAVFALAVVCATAFVQVVVPPDVSSELRRLGEGNVAGTDPLLATRQGLEFILAHSAPGSEVAILARWPRTLTLAAGVDDVVPFASMPFSTYPELELLVEALRAHPDAAVYLKVTDPVPEIRSALTQLGFRPVDHGGVLVLWRVTTRGQSGRS